VAGDAYPDLPHWVAQASGSCAGGAPEASADEHAAAARAAGAALVLLERPSLTADRFADPEELRALCAALAPAGTVVLVDESNAGYCPPAFGAARLIRELPNLLVLRGLSKGFGLGGLRLGYTLASAPLRERVRACVPPLQAGSLSLRIGVAVLRLGDVAAPLRARIVDSKAELRALLRAAGFAEAAPASAPLPYVLLDERDGPPLERIGLLGKTHLRWSGARGRSERLHRLSAPLAPARRERLRALLSPAAGADAAPPAPRSAPASRAPARSASAGCTSPSGPSARASPS
jgi:histidinol-phosphate/aromatic aminotransferase/cobyric acid decarboxylase-like protein